MIYLFWPRNQPFHISHINPSRQDTQVVDSHHSIDILMLLPYILTSFFYRNSNGFHGKLSLMTDHILDKRLIPVIYY